jgi:hypothetical protein
VVLEAKEPRKKRKIVDHECDLSTPIHNEIVLWAVQNRRNIYEKEFGSLSPSKEVQYSVEYPVKAISSRGPHNSYEPYHFNAGISGYMDLVLWCRDSLEKRIERTGMPNDEHDKVETDTLYIEVKSKVPSFGEIMRELQCYHSLLQRVRSADIVLLCPSTPFAEIIREQGFTVIKYRGDETFSA